MTLTPIYVQSWFLLPWGRYTDLCNPNPKIRRGRFQLCSRDICHDFNYYFILNYSAFIKYMCYIRKQFQIESKKKPWRRTGFFQISQYRKSNTHLVFSSVSDRASSFPHCFPSKPAISWFIPLVWIRFSMGLNASRVILILFHESPNRQLWILYIHFHLICFQ